MRSAVPKCACGCGQPVTMSPRKKTWNKWVRNHHPQNHAERGDPWNKGNVALHRHACKTCSKKFKNRKPVADFCTRACYHAFYSGEQSHLYGNGFRTKYRTVWIDGVAKKEHRVLMAAWLGRRLKKSEVVHHIDGNGLNNAAVNLHLFHCESCHQHFHKAGASLQYVYVDVHV